MLHRSLITLRQTRQFHSTIRRMGVTVEVSRSPKKREGELTPSTDS